MKVPPSMFQGEIILKMAAKIKPVSTKARNFSMHLVVSSADTSRLGVCDVSDASKRLFWRLEGACERGHSHGCGSFKFTKKKKVLNAGIINYSGEVAKATVDWISFIFRADPEPRINFLVFSPFFFFHVLYFIFSVFHYYY